MTSWMKAGRYLWIGIIFLFFSVFQPQISLAEEQVAPESLAGKKHFTIVSGARNMGLGDFTYGIKLYRLLRATHPEYSYSLILWGSEKNERSIQRVFSLSEEIDSDFIWLTISADKNENYFITADEQDEFAKKINLKIPQNSITAYIAFHGSSNLDKSEAELLQPQRLLRSLGVVPDFIVDSMFYRKLSHQTASESLERALQGMNYTPEFPHSLAKTFRYTTDVTAITDDEIDQFLLRPFLAASYVINHTYNFFSDLFAGEPIEKGPNNRYWFGVGGSDRKIGLLLSDQQKKDARSYYSGSGIHRRALLKKRMSSLTDDFLRMLTGFKSRNAQIRWLDKQADFSVAYMHKPFSLLEFIAATAPVSEERKDLKYVINAPNFYLTEDQEAELMSEIETDGFATLNGAKYDQSRLFKQILKDNNISRYVYWSADNPNPVEYELDTEGLRTLWIVNPFPLPKKSLEMLMMASAYPYVGCTGDQSFYDAVSLGKIPVYEELPHLYGFRDELAAIAEQDNLAAISSFFSSKDTVEQAQTLMSPDIQREWALLAEALWSKHNGNHRFEQIFLEKMKASDVTN